MPNSPTPSALPATLTPFPPAPTATPEPLAAIVNGQAITLAEFQAELARYQSAAAGGANTPPGSTPAASPGPESTQAGIDLASQGRKQVLDDLIDQTLLAQATVKDGFVVDDVTVQAHMDQLASQLGGAQGLESWMAAHGYQEAGFRQDLARSIAAAHMRDQIIASVPAAVEQVHARQILLYNSDQANQVLARIQAGADFAELAAQVDPVMHGDLDWFPRGYLTDQALEDAAFSLQPDQHSGVIHTSLGYHILQVIERDPQHPLSPDARLVLQNKALADWLKQRRSQSQIQILIS